MTRWVWMPLPALHVIHDRQISRHGGAPGTRDPSLLEAACARPLNRAGYGNPDVHALAAAYAFGVAKAHALHGPGAHRCVSALRAAALERRQGAVSAVRDRRLGPFRRSTATFSDFGKRQLSVSGSPSLGFLSDNHSSAIKSTGVDRGYRDELAGLPGSLRIAECRVR